jgi:hypothetical protein
MEKGRYKAEEKQMEGGRQVSCGCAMVPLAPHLQRAPAPSFKPLFHKQPHTNSFTTYLALVVQNILQHLPFIS